MIRTVQEFFQQRIRSQAEGDPGRALRLATAALFIEVSRADHIVKDAEQRAVAQAVQRTFNLTDDETNELVQLAEEEAQAAVSLYQFTSLIDKGFSRDEKIHIVELLWQVAYADHDKDKHEEHLVRRIADLLHVSHKDFIAAKLRARENR